MGERLIDRVLVGLSGHILDPSQVLTPSWENYGWWVMALAGAEKVRVMLTPPPTLSVSAVHMMNLLVGYFLTLLKPAEDALAVIPSDGQLDVPTAPLLQVLSTVGLFGA